MKASGWDKAALKVFEQFGNPKKTTFMVRRIRDLAVTDMVRLIKSGLEIRGQGVPGIDYSELEMAFLGDGEAAVWLPASMRQLEAATDAWMTAVDVRLVGVSTEDAQFLSQHGPWLPELLPEWVKDQALLLSSRRITVEETDALLESLLAQPDVVERLERWGKIQPNQSEEEQTRQIRALAFPDGLMAEENLVWLALRTEFGIRGPANPHIKKSLKIPKAILSKSLGNILQRVIGRGYAPGPQITAQISQEEKDAMDAFAEMVLARKAPKRKDVS